MRIIAGSLKGRRLHRPGEGIRPTSDRLRESLFSCLGTRVQGSVWMDVFAGSGAIGLEAISRGADFVYFNDRVRRSVQLVQRNLSTCRVEEGFTLSRQEALSFLRAPRDRPIDFIYLDPPYQEGLEDSLLAAISAGPKSLNKAIILIEHFKKNPISLPDPRWQILRTLKAGNSRIEIIEQQPAERE